MTSAGHLEVFGQLGPAPEHMSELARSITRGIDDGRPAPFAGFVWYRPHGSPLDVMWQSLDRPIRGLEAA